MKIFLFSRVPFLISHSLRRVPTSMSPVELRRACLQLVLSLVCVPSGIKSLEVPALFPPSTVLGVGAGGVGGAGEGMTSQAPGGAGGPPKGGAVAALFGVTPPQRSAQVGSGTTQQPPVRTFEEHRLQIISMLFNALQTETQLQQTSNINHDNMQMILCMLKHTLTYRCFLLFFLLHSILVSCV